ncbi:MAG: hypothetical protein PHS04_08935 [Tissierellia bacterium]|nr:hypothetical protein [Tissierellia bacterium]
MKIKKEVKLLLDRDQLEHIIRTYFGFTMDKMHIGVISGVEGCTDYREDPNPTLCVLAIEEVETS